VTDPITSRISGGLAARRQAELRVPDMLAASQAATASDETPSTVQQRSPSAISEKMANFIEMSEQLRNGADSRNFAPARPHLPGTSDRLPPAYDGNPRADNHISKLHTEIKLDGKVIGRIYNSGAAEFADDYSYLAAGFKGETLLGPDLAEQRLAKVKAALERSGATFTDGKSENYRSTVAGNFSASVVEILRASTAQTQQEWLAFKSTESPSPGALLSRTA
jgi:hypothetical protein